MDFIAVASYGAATKTSGVVRIVKDLDLDLTGRHVIIVEDIVDSGLTLSYLRKSLLARGPGIAGDLHAVAESGTAADDFEAEYVGFEIAPDFVVGYGLDVAERYRNLPDLRVLPRRESRSEHRPRPGRSRRHRAAHCDGGGPHREGLQRTPTRVADMYEELFGDIHEPPDRFLTVTFAAEHDEMVMVRDIPFASLCEHHLVPFLGKAHVAYIPSQEGRITGLSKLARVVDGYARRLQVQERMTRRSQTRSSASSSRAVCSS